MGVNIMMCDVMRSRLVLFSSQSVALAGVLLPTGGPHTSHITVHCHDITIALLSPLPIQPRVFTTCVSTPDHQGHGAAWERLMVR